MTVYALGDRVPHIDKMAFVHPDAVIIGAVTIAADASIWPGAVLRGDYGEIRIGGRTSIQDGTVIHATEEFPTIVGQECVVGHLAHLEGCRVSDHVLVGSQSVVLHDAMLEEHCVVGAGAFVGNRKRIPSFALALGVPARLIENAVTVSEIDDAVIKYVENARRYRKEMRLLE